MVTMRDQNSRATLSAALLNPSSAGRRVDLCLVDQNTSSTVIAGADKRPEIIAAPLFCEKGDASAVGFDPLGVQLPVASASRSERNAVQRVRVWFRIDPERRSKLKQAAAGQKLTRQALLVSAVDSFMTQYEAIPEAAAASLAMITKGVSRRAPKCHRHKVAIWVRPEKKEQIRAMAERLGLTIQAFLQAALDEKLDLIAPCERAARYQVVPTADGSGGSAGILPSDLMQPLGNATPVSAEIIPLRRVRQLA
jgi:hypothetical protein